MLLEQEYPGGMVLVQDDTWSRTLIGRALTAMVSGLVRSSIFAGCALLVPACVALVPVLAAFGLLGSPWSWVNPWSWVGLVLIGVPVALVLSHPVAVMFRRLIVRWTAVRIESGYRAFPPPVKLAMGYWWNGVSHERTYWDARMDQRVQRVREPAYWREVRWVVIAAFTVGVVCAIPCLALVAAVELLVSGVVVSMVAGTCMLIIGLLMGPWAWRIVLPLAQRWLAPASGRPSTVDLQQQRADLCRA